jgi:signal transduction histidine kinase
MLVLMCVGFLILLAMCLIFPWVSIYLLHSSSHLNLRLTLDALALGLMGLAFIWLLFTILRTWYAFFSIYMMDGSGIRILFLSSDVFIGWDQLYSAKYRRASAQLELRFHGYSRLVVLNNVDMNMRRKSLHAAISLIEKKSSVPIRQSLA